MELIQDEFISRVLETIFLKFSERVREGSGEQQHEAMKVVMELIFEVWKPPSVNGS